jgi:hypothetical protein
MQPFKIDSVDEFPEFLPDFHAPKQDRRGPVAALSVRGGGGGQMTRIDPSIRDFYYLERQ